MRKMKNSGIEWIGEIPDSWRLNKIGQLFNLRNEKVSDKLYAPLSVSRGGVVPQMESVAKSDANDDRKLVLAGDFAINSRSDRKQSCGVSSLDGSVSLINLILYVKDKSFVYANYLNYLLKNYGFAEEFYKWGHGIVADLWTTRWQEMKSIVLPLPTALIQQNIAAFLDKKLAEVDKLIEVQQAQIEKLKEYKQSAITEAVTKGLDPSVPMKDSGIEWLGKIPASWNVVRIKNLPDYTKENAFVDGDWIESPNISDEGIRYLTTGNIGNGIYKRQGNGYVSNETFSVLDCKYAYPNDLVIARLNAPFGRSCILPADEKQYVVAVDIVILRTAQNKRYICYVTQCPNFQHSVEDFARGTAMKRISRSNLGSVSICLPPLSEQQQIADYLDDKCAKIDKLIALKQEKIEKLNEYKKSLIYEYVTGKKEVV